MKTMWNTKAWLTVMLVAWLGGWGWTGGVQSAAFLPVAVNSSMFDPATNQLDMPRVTILGEEDAFLDVRIRIIDFGEITVDDPNVGDQIVFIPPATLHLPQVVIAGETYPRISLDGFAFELLHVGSIEVNTAPVANADVDQRVVVGANVSLDGSSSSDANGDSLTYSWSLATTPLGSSAILNSSTDVKPSFNADMAGTYVISLSVNDGKLSSEAKTTTITVVPRIDAALGISLSSGFVFCGLSGEFTIVDLGYFSPWIVQNCSVFGNAGSALFVRIQNNGSTSLALTKIYVLASHFGHGWNVEPASQAIQPGGTVEFALPLWMDLEVTNAVATLSLTGEPDLIVQLKGSMTLP